MVMKMPVTLETIHKDIKQMQNDLSLVKHIMEEEYELSEETRQELHAARKRMKNGDFVSHETVMKKYG